jgi:hypothetical protein
VYSEVVVAWQQQGKEPLVFSHFHITIDLIRSLVMWNISQWATTLAVAIPILRDGFCCSYLGLFYLSFSALASCVLRALHAKFHVLP